MKGTGAATFHPDAALTQAQLLTILWRVAGQPVVNAIMPYTDVETGVWYAEAARWAGADHITERGDGLLEPDETLRRDEAVMLLWNTAKYLGADVSVGEDTNILSYLDAFDIREGYAPAMQWAVGAGVIEGTGDERLEPEGPLTRAQTAVLLRRYGAALV